MKFDIRRSSFFLFSLALLLLGASQEIYAEPTEVKLLPPAELVNCPAKYGDNGVFTVGGAISYKPIGNVYCLSDDRQWVRGTSGLLDRLSEGIASIGDVKEIDVSANYFDSELVGSWLCSIKGSASALRVFVQRSNGSLDSSSHLTPDFAGEVLGCFTKLEIITIGCDHFKAASQAKCPQNQTSSHHIKGIRVRGASGFVYAFGSGNFTLASVTRNIENWLIFTSPSRIERFDCIYSFSEAISKHPDARYRQQRDTYNGCTAFSPELVDTKVVILPFQEDDFKSEFEKQYSRAKSVVLVGQFFESNWLFDTVARYPTVHSTFIVDSSYYYAEILAKRRASGERIEAADYDLNFVSLESAERFARLIEGLPNAEVRYLQTNSNFRFHKQTNTVHARSVVFDGDNGPVVLVGSAHWRDGSFSGNTEQEIFLYGEKARSQVEAVAGLVARTTDATHLPKTLTSATPTPADGK